MLPHVPAAPLVMKLLFGAALLLHVAGALPAQAQRADTVQAAADSGARRDTTRRAPRRVPLTPALEASAFANEGARELLQRARAARFRQDTSLIAYDATAYQRVSVGMGLRRFARERLIFREEEATRVQWHRDRGVLVDVVGRRQASPSGGVTVNDGGSVPIPYVPGQETLWIGSGIPRVEVDDRGPVHPLAEGSEAYYRYSIGDSVAFRLPDGRTIRLREMRIQPRQPRWNLSVGSLWFDLEEAQLVRAVYRLSVPMEIWDVVRESEDDDDDEVPAAVKALLNPMRATVSAVTVEYGLEAGRFWLPRLQALDAEAQVSMMRVPVRFEQSFRYQAVNGSVDVPPRVVALADSGNARSVSVTIGGAPPSDSGRRVSRDSAQARRDSVRTARAVARQAQCDSGGTFTQTSTRMDGAVAVTVRTPCDTSALINSPALPGSIYDTPDELLGDSEREALIRDFLTLGNQAGWSPQVPVFRYGFGDGLLRYNRVEGLSPAIRVEQQLGRGYALFGQARIGFADLEPNIELGGTRDDGRRLLRLGGFRRLSAANDWGEPLGFGASAMAVTFGRDEGLYYRTWGLELAGEGRTPTGAGGQFSWRAFVERQGDAPRETNFSLANAIGNQPFLDNIGAERLTLVGFGARWFRTYGLDPAGVRALVSVRGDGGAGDRGFGRGLLDLTVSRPLVERIDGAITLSGGSSVGRVPTQRLFYLGDPWTVRGLQANTARGDAYWFGRAEIARGSVTARPVIFYDVGWAGARGDWQNPGTPLSGAGVGMSFLDGIVRTDLSRGIRPTQQWRFDVYFESRF